VRSQSNSPGSADLPGAGTPCLRVRPRIQYSGFTLEAARDSVRYAAVHSSDVGFSAAAAQGVGVTAAPSVALTAGGSTYYTPEASALSSSLGRGNSDTGLFGEFIKNVTMADAAIVDGPATAAYGAMGVQLSK
jgi:hypothetical protein